jgi:hypothetical protein
MARITFVSADYDDTLPMFGAAIIVRLDNTQVLFLSLESKAADPVYAVLRANKKLFEVKSDGESIYWPDGPQLSFDGMIEMLRGDGIAAGDYLSDRAVP